MGGGLMQLVAYGAQDIYLTGNPQITFFKVVYRRHTNFSMEAIEQTWNGGEKGTADGRCTATISRNGDLVHRMYLELEYSTLTDCNNPGSRFISSVELEIGGQKIDKQTGDWMETWAQLTEPNPTGVTTNGATAGWAGSATQFQRMSGMGGVDAAVHGKISESLYIPLQFWFCRNPGLALPLIALQYHEVKLILNYRGSAAQDSSAGKNNLWVDYIYLDTDERRRFAQVSHEYLIEQVQEQSWSTSSAELNFNHPVKELIWSKLRTSQTDDSVAIAGSGETFLLKLNGHDRFSARQYEYFSRTQVYQHHSGPGGLGTSSADLLLHGFNDSIGVYSFALKPEEHQPSGTCNFSRIDNAQLISASTGTNVVYAVNYNVLRIMSGMGGLAYSN